MVGNIREVETALGDGVKKIEACEIHTKQIVQKYIVAVTEINAGDEFSEQNLTCIRSAKPGLHPKEFFDLLGKKASKNYARHEVIEL